MTNPRIADSINRRAALAGLGAGGLGIALAATVRQASAQDTTEMANHPIVGTWNAITPGGPALATFLPNGSATFAVQASAMNPGLGLVFQSSGVGTWEPVDEHTAHFTAGNLLTDATGTYLGASMTDGYPVVSDDGMSLSDDNSKGKVTVYDAAGNVAQEFSTAGAPPVTGVRMAVGAPGFVPTPAAATPTS